MSFRSTERQTPKMTEDNIEIIRELLKAGWTVKKIAEKLGISQSSIYAYFPSDILKDLRPTAL